MNNNFDLKNSIDGDEEIPIKNIIELEVSSNKKVLRKRRTIKLWVWLVLLVILLVVIVFSGYKIFNWYNDNIKTSNILESIDDDYIEVEDNDNTEYIGEDTDVSDYWYYITFPLINVDFTELKKKNNDTVAWINVNNTNINYPVVQTDDNDYYLTHSYDKSYNEAGWVFMDFRNNSNLDNKNTIIYAHSRLDKTMFGSLSKVLNSDWYTNKDNHIIRVSTPYVNSLYQIFSVYVIKEESYYIQTSFSSDNDYENFLDTLESRSKYDFNTSLDKDSQIITLSTCYSDTERTVVHAKLIKREKR